MKVLYYLFFTIASVTSLAQTWEKVYGFATLSGATTSGVFFEDLIEMDSCIYTSGIAVDYPNFEQKPQMFKIDINGDTLKTKVFRDLTSSLENFYNFFGANQHHLFILNSIDSAAPYMELTKVDANLNLIKRTRIKMRLIDSVSFHPTYMKPKLMNQNLFVVAAERHFNGVYKSFLTACDSSGNILWTRVCPFFSTGGSSSRVNILKTLDEKIAWSRELYDGLGNEMVIVEKVDTNGSLVWVDTIIGAYSVYGIDQFSDSTYMMTYSNITNNYVVKLNKNGGVIWNKPIPYVHITFNGLVLDNDNIILASDSITFNYPDPSYPVNLQLDSSANLICTDSVLLGHSLVNSGWNLVTKSADKKFVYGVYQVKDTLGIIRKGVVSFCNEVSIVDSEKELNFIKLYPNPNAGIFTVETNEHTSARIEIVDVLGIQIKSLNHTNSRSVIDLSSVPKGIYLLSVISETKRINRKILIE